MTRTPRREAALTDETRLLHQDPFGKQLPDTVASHVREMILSGKVRKGEFIRLETIAKQLHMSTTPVREGLRLLHGENFVRLIPRRGFVVIGFTEQDIMDVFCSQAHLAGELAARAARLMTPDQIAHLERIQAELDLAVQNDDRKGVASIGHEFHRAINHAANSPRIALLLGAITKQLSKGFYTTLDGFVKDIHPYHPLVLDAIRRRDAEAARTLMFQHVLRGGDHLVAKMTALGIFDGAPVDVDALQPDPHADDGAAGLCC